MRERLSGFDCKTGHYQCDTATSVVRTVLGQLADDMMKHLFSSRVLTSFFLPALERPGGYENVRTWTKTVRAARAGSIAPRPDILYWSLQANPKYAQGAGNQALSFDKIIVPVHKSGNHWCCGCLDFKQKQVQYYDSMKLPVGKFFSQMREWMEAESRAKYDRQFDFSGELV